MMKRLAFTFALGISLLFGASDSAPEWVREAATRTLPNYPAEVQAATLLHEEHVTVSPDGSTLTQEREAVRILAQEGASRASCGVPYFKKVTKIRDLKAWLIAPDGASKTYGKDYVLDVAAKEDFVLYEDLRAKVIEARNPVPGSTFGWSSEVEDHPHDPQILWGFQGRDPSLLSRLVLTLPQGWEAKAVTFNHEEIKPTVDGSTYTWELKDLNFIKRERSSPGPSSLSPWIGVTYYATSSPNAPREWKDISISESKLDEPQAVTNERLNAEVRQLTASASNSLDQIRAIGRYVQSLKYVEIATNLATGGGSLPHPAVQVFEKQYGDCKDKANLMRTMLRQIGVESYMVALFSGDRNRVRPEWPSGEQFNHMIIAIKVPDGTALPSTLVHPVLGKLLIFDSTDPYTPLGLLPDDEQGSYGLLLAGDKGGILQLPIAPPETNRTDVAVEGTLLPDGGLQAKLAMNTRADRAAELRATRSNHREDFEKAIQEWLQRNVKQVETEPLQAKDSFDTGELDVDLSFKAPRYGQLMQGRILVFRPAIVEPYHGFPVQSEKRENPLVLDSQCYHKQVRVKLPENFKIDEMPEAASFTSSFGKYSSDYKVANNELVFTEELNVSATTIPAEKYKEARDFFGKVVGAERAPMVLVKN